MKNANWLTLVLMVVGLSACGDESETVVDAEPGLPSVVEMLELGCGGDSVCLDAVKTHYEDCQKAVSQSNDAPTDAASLTTAVSICIGERVNAKSQ